MNEDTNPKFPIYLTRYAAGKEKQFAKQVFVWQCAFAGCSNSHFVLREQIWKRLREYTYLDRSYNRKEYDSADVALQDMRRATDECDECEERRKGRNTVGA